MHLALALCLFAAPGAHPRFDAALALAPADTTALVVIADPKRMSDDLQQCLERMDRAETAMAGRPIDQFKAALGISASFDDNGALLLMQVPAAEGEESALLALLPSTDPPAFAAANFTVVPERGEDAWRARNGTLLYAKPLARHVVVGTDAPSVRSFTPPAEGGMQPVLRERLGPRGYELAAQGDCIAWSGPDAIRGALRVAREQGKRAIASDAPFAAQAIAMQEAWTELLDGAEDGLLVIDADPLGLSLRTWARLREGSELASLAAGGASRGSRFDRLPTNPFYVILRADVAGLGGVGKLEQLLAKFPGGWTLPAWLVESGEHLQGLQFAISPSRMGIATGGLLNDATLVLTGDRPDQLRANVRTALEATAGEENGLRRTVTFTGDKELRSGERADAFEVEETILPEVAGSRLGDLALRRVMVQAIFGSRGFTGFLKQVPGGVIMTFSQRTDVLGRAIEASTGKGTLADDGTLAAYADWLIEDADVEGFIGVGQFGRLLRQLATMVPGGDGMTLPEIPTSVEPVAFAFDLRDGSAESALVIPTGVLGLFYDEARRRMRARLLDDAP